MKVSNIIISFAALCSFSLGDVKAQTAPSWGDAQGFGVLAYSTITNTGNTVVTGDMGVSPGSAITGFNPPGKQINGVMYSGAPSLAGNAQTAATAAYTNLMGQKTTTDLTGKMLGTEVASLNPGVYNYSSSAGLTGTLTLNDGGDPNAVFIFKMGSTLTTASYSKVVMSSGGNGPNVFWVCGSSATIGTYTTFVGNTIALASITMTTGATTTGRLFALNGAVTMDTNNAYASAAVPKAIDTDGDGVPDAKDDYPTDPNKAYNNYSSPINGSTIVFEDLWPDKGDYDMNDLVMKYKYNVITNAQNNVTQVIGNFTLLAAGTGYKDAFAIEFPIANGAVSGLTGGVLEAGQNKAVIVLFTDKDKEINGWNTLRGVSIVAPKNYTISFDVINGPSLSLFGTDYNPFIFNYIGSSRKEVHLPGKTPTTLSDLSYFGTLDDASSVSAGKYYVTKTGLPFAIIIPSDVFEYPFEYADISTAYLHFADWAESGGTKYADWYSNTSPAYRNTNNIFH